VPTCGPADDVEAVRARASAAGWDVAVVVADDGVVLGLLRIGPKTVPGAVAADAMEPAPPTVRAHLAPADVPASARRHDAFLVTTPDGVLLGLVRSRELQAQERPKPERSRRPRRPGLVIGPTTGGADVQLEPGRG
jgi:hypothetical protein